MHLKPPLGMYQLVLTKHDQYLLGRVEPELVGDTLFAKVLLEGPRAAFPTLCGVKVVFTDQVARGIYDQRDGSLVWAIGAPPPRKPLSEREGVSSPATRKQ